MVSLIHAALTQDWTIYARTEVVVLSCHLALVKAAWAVLAQATLTGNSVANGITHSDIINFAGRRFCDEHQHLLIRKELNVKGHSNAAMFGTQPVSLHKIFAFGAH